MGIVYQAVDERDGRAVALKVIRETETSGSEGEGHAAEARVRFEREAEILRGLLHSNIVEFYEIGEEDGTPYLAMEYLDGVPLGSLAGRPFTETLPLLIQAAHGMEILSSRGIVHRDLSPDNILVVEGAGGRIAKLLDFGVAKLFAEHAAGQSLTATGFFMGKVAYGSPEQLGSLGQGAPLDWRSDVYSLGVIFYQVLAGRRPFEGKAPVEYIAAHLNLIAPPVAAPPGCPPLPIDLVRLVAQMLEKRREQRPQSYREITDRLVAVLRSGTGDRRAKEGLPPAPPAGDTGPTQLVSPHSSDPPPGSAHPHFRRSLAVLGLTLLLVLLVLFARSRDGRLWPLSGKPVTSPRVAVAKTPAAAATKARLQVLALPYGRVVSVTDSSTGAGIPLPSPADTPVVIEVPPGSYRVAVESPAAAGKRLERDVTLRAGESALVTVPFLSTDQLMETLR